MTRDTTLIRRYSKDLSFFLIAEGFVLLTVLSQSKSEAIRYQATGSNFLSVLHAAHPQAQLDKLLHIIFSLIIYLIFKRTINSCAAVLGVIVFGIGSIHRLVFLSAPFWDFVNYLPVAIAILVLIEFHYPDSIMQRRNSRKFIPFIQTMNIWLLLIILFLEFCRKYQGLFPQLMKSTIFYVIGAAVLFYFSRYFQVRSAILFRRLDYSDQLFLQVYLFNILLSATYCRFTTSLVPILLNVLLIVIFGLGKSKFSNCLTIFMVITSINLLVLVNLNFFSASGVGFGFYFLAGFSNPANIPILFQYRQFDPMVKFWDSDIKQSLALMQDKHLSAFFQNPLPFVERLHSHLIDFFEYFSFSYGLGEPLSGLPPTVAQYWMYWSSNSITPAISKLSIFFFAILLIIKFGMKSIFIVSPIVFLFIFVMLTRPQLHQWWIWDMCGVWTMFMVTDKFANFLYRPTAVKDMISRTLRIGFQRLTALLIIATLTLGLGHLSVFSKRFPSLDLNTMKPGSGWRLPDLDSSKLSIQLTRMENDYRIKVFEGIRLRITPNRECINFQFSVFEIESIHQTDRLITSGQSANGENFILSLQPGNFELSFHTLSENDCEPQFSFAKESDFTSMPGALFVGKFENKERFKLSKKATSVTDISGLPSSIRLASNAFSGRIVNTNYIAYGLDNLKLHLAKNDSAMKLGFTGEGYMLRDIESFRYMNSMEAKSLRVYGTLKFGNIGFLNSTEKDTNRDLFKNVDVEFTYLRPGSPKKFNFCFPLAGNNSYKLTIFQFQDQYGFGWSDYSDLNFKMNRLPCAEIGYNFHVGVRAGL